MTGINAAQQSPRKLVALSQFTIATRGRAPSGLEVLCNHHYPLDVSTRPQTIEQVLEIAIRYLNGMSLVRVARFASCSCAAMLPMAIEVITHFSF